MGFFFVMKMAMGAWLGLFLAPILFFFLIVILALIAWSIGEIVQFFKKKPFGDNS